MTPRVASAGALVRIVASALALTSASTGQTITETEEDADEARRPPGSLAGLTREVRRTIGIL